LLSETKKVSFLSFSKIQTFENYLNIKTFNCPPTHGIEIADQELGTRCFSRRLPIKPNHEESWDGKPRVPETADSRVAEAREILRGSWSILTRALFFGVLQFISAENAKGKEIGVNGEAAKVHKRR